MPGGIHSNYVICRGCSGSKTVPDIDESGEIIGERNCNSCHGTGKMGISWIELGDNIFESHVILECLDPTEHNALTDAQKEGILLILACGQVNLNVGKVGRTRLLNWFGAESTTVANLTALIS